MNEILIGISIAGGSAVIGLIVKIVGDAISKASFAPAFEKKVKEMEASRLLHEEVMRRTGTSQAVIIHASNGGKLPSNDNGWEITIMKGYEIGEGNQVESIMDDWKKQRMDDEYWEMVNTLLGQKVLFFPDSSASKSRRLRDSHVIYKINGYVLLLYGINPSWRNKGIRFARFAYKEGDDLSRINTPETKMVFENYRESLSRFFAKNW